MVVWNNNGYYAAYCHACHIGARENKEFASTAKPQQAKRPRGLLSTSPGQLWPLDVQKAREFDPLFLFPQARADIVAKAYLHWQEKGVSLPVLAEYFPQYSHKDQRIVLSTPQGLLGRDLTGQHPAKWYNYNPDMEFAVAGDDLHGADVVVTEDFYSAAKVSHYTRFVGVASLGTVIRPGLLVELFRAKHVLMAYDGDEAGVDGSMAARSQLSVCGVPFSLARIPDGCDPKDLNPDDLCRVLEAYYNP